ncbi:efflux RND transporter periplasmic adaptor subunit [Chitinimonas viridis]|uniref:Efflux RND transporter periplasmic adaptor subunit n=1 Tax=Chitinimonas viridis TaxID=664880 RepID=A0ABT8B687_9NEIS|nr:efflux RND transporter periplasmic adaptor subunit [Chitinimonas viridis]MDN3577515.1 efflux RND transporter periplasmic adaptor subunit [Chitinimonas viridis]
MRKHGWWLAILLVAIVAGIGWYWRPRLVQVSKPAQGTAVEAIYASGQVEPGVQVPITTRSAGQVTAVLVQEGEAVRRGQILIQLQDDDLASGVAELAARAELARQQLQRAEVLWRQGFVAAAERDAAASANKAAQAALLRSQAQRRFLQLVAPADGEILQRDVEVGQVVSPGQALLYLACCAPMRVVAEVDEEDIGRVQQGQPVVLGADALPGKTFDGVVSSITPKGDPLTRSYRVRIAIDQPERFRVGMTVDANVILARRERALLLPRSAVREGLVWRVQDGRLTQVRVTTGASMGDQVEIRSGIGPDDLIVSVPDEQLAVGQVVRIRQAEAGPARTGSAP